MHDDMDNELIIIFEDTSAYGDPVGRIESVQLQYNQEGIEWSDNGPMITRGIRAKVETSLIESQIP